MSDQAIETIRDSVRRLQAYSVAEGYRGYDPYDYLGSPLFKLPVLRSSHSIRFVVQQVGRRIPLNLRPLLAIRKGLNPVTLGLCVQSFSHLLTAHPEGSELYLKEARWCIDQLKDLTSPGYAGTCWGYDFDWESRYARVDAYVPTIVATGIITNGLFEFYQATRNDDALALCRSAVRFLLQDLKRTDVNGDSFFSYSPHDSQAVLNATMKGARLLAQVYSVDKQDVLRETASANVRFVLRHQRPDGSWGYSVSDDRKWADNFHTGYVLDCLHEYRSRTGDQSVDKALSSGFRFYLSHFIDESGRPRYYSDRAMPIDSTAGAQSILTLCRFGEKEIAKRTALWMISHMQARDGHFFYRRGRFFPIKVSYMRWSNAWMFAGLSFLLKKCQQ